MSVTRASASVSRARMARRVGSQSALKTAVELRGLIFTHMGEYRRATIRGCQLIRKGQGVAQRSIVMLTGQWSLPSTSAWIFASFTFFLSDSDTST